MEKKVAKGPPHGERKWFFFQERGRALTLASPRAPMVLYSGWGHLDAIPFEKCSCVVVKIFQNNDVFATFFCLWGHFSPCGGLSATYFLHVFFFCLYGGLFCVAPLRKFLRAPLRLGNFL